jgi:hypothetical protein
MAEQWGCSCVYLPPSEMPTCRVNCCKHVLMIVLMSTFVY